MASEFTKDPDAVLDYQVDWTTWLNGDTISVSTWTVATGLTQVSATNTTTTATVWLSGGTVDQSYTVANKIVTAGGARTSAALRLWYGSDSMDELREVVTETPTDVQAPSMYRWTVWLLGIVAVLVVLSMATLNALDKPVSDGLAVMGGGAVTGLVGLLARRQA